MRSLICAVFLAVLTSVGGCGDESFTYNPLDPMVRFESEPELPVEPESPVELMEPPIFGKYDDTTVELPAFGRFLNITLNDSWVGGCHPSSIWVK